MDIVRLNSAQLQALINKLVGFEALRHSIPLSGGHGTDPARITVADGGSDASIEWTKGPQKTNYFPARQVLFQVKAEKMPESRCRDEVLNESLPRDKPKGKKTKSKKGGRKQTKKNTALMKPSVKVAIRECLEEDGAYIIFCHEAAEGSRHKDRLKGIREGLRLGGLKGWRSARIDFYDANKIRDWVNQYPPVINWVFEQLKRGTWHSAHTWEQWSGYSDVKGQFVADAVLKSRISDLLLLLKSSAKTARLVGLSGLGKTRLAFETLRPPPESETNAWQQVLSDSVLYINAAGQEDAVLDLANQLRVDALPALLVVDDCRPEFHDRLAKIAMHSESQFRLLTLDYDPVPKMPEYEVVAIDPVSDDVIKGILSQSAQPLAKEEIEYLVRFSQGYPKIAVLLRDQALKTGSRASLLSDDVLLMRMVWGRDTESSEAFKALSICSVFTSLGYEEEAQSQADAAAALVELSPQAFRGHIERFKDRGIVQQRGRFVRVLPLPLALRLAEDWWRSVTPKDAKAIITGISADMVETMCEQLRYLDTLAHARKIAADLCGTTGPFGSAEVLNTETGSRCFRALVELNPEATLATLERTIGELDIEGLKTLTAGRRSIVVALEHLVFHADFFSRAAELLRRLALAETESWANNATGQFVQLFHAYLPGTETSLAARASYLSQISKGSVPESALALRALEHALEPTHYSRMSGAEEQGTKRLKDYTPARDKEIHDYWVQVLALIVAVANLHAELRQNALNAVSHNLRGLLGRGMLEEVRRTIEALLPLSDNYWPQALEQVATFMHFEGPSADKKYLAQVEQLRLSLLPTDLRQQVRLYVSEMPWDLFSFDEKTWDTPNDPRTLKAVALADELIEAKTRLLEILPALVVGEQRNIHPFGAHLGQNIDNPIEFAQKIVEALRKEGEHGNPSLLGAFLAGLAKRDRKPVTAVLDALAQDKDFVGQIPYLTTAAGVHQEDVIRVEKLVRSRSLPSNAIRYFSLGRAVDSIDDATLKRLLRSAMETGVSGAWDALNLAYMHIHGRPERKALFTDVFTEILLTPGLLTVSENGLGRHNLDAHQLEVIASWLIQDSPNGAEVARHLANELVALCKKKKFPYELDHALDPIVKAMATKFPDTVWPVFSDAVRTGDSLLESHLGTLLSSGTTRSKNDKSQPLVLFPLATLMSWLESYPEGANFLLRHLPPLKLDGAGEKTWHPYVRTLIDRFGTKDSLGELSANIWTFGWTGSMVPYFEQYLPLFKQLRQHERAIVRKWANSQLATFEEQIRKEKRRQEEQELGRY